MKKINWIIGFFLLVTVLKFVSNSTRHVWTYNTSSIDESKRVDSFICSYRVVDINYSENNNYLKNIDDLLIWKEEQYTTEPFLIFFHPKRTTGKKSLIIKSKIFNEKPTLYAKLKGKNYSGNQKGTHIILTEEKIELIEEVVLYYDNNRRLGTIKIQAIE